MHFTNSVEFVKYKNKTVILQYKIQTISYDNFRHGTFTTDKHINLCDWEYIHTKIQSFVKDFDKDKGSWRGKTTTFKVNDLIIKLDTIDREDGCINFKKFDYNLEWIINISISLKNSTSPEKRNGRSIKNVENHKCEVSQDSENAILVEDDSCDMIHESKKMKLDVAEKSDLAQKICVGFTLRNREGKSKQGDLNNWVNKGSKPPEEKKSQKSKQSKSSSKEIKATTSKELKGTTSKDLGNQLSKEDLEQMKSFVARSEEEEQKKEKRKKELENFEILNCWDMKNDEISQIVKQLKSDIIDILENESSNLTLYDGQIKHFEITASNILNQKQLMFALNEIENLRSMDRRGTNEVILHDFVLPYVIIEIFKKNHSLSTKQAIIRIKKQDEKKILFKEEGFNDSY